MNFNQLNLVKSKPGIHLKPFVPDKHRDLVVTDCSRVRQVLSNFLSNAYKFLEKGIISFGFDVKESEIIFFVKDEGMGIAVDKITEIFERFKQLNYEENAKYRGTGLGLAICKEIVELLGGKISVESTIDKRTEFTFTIPLIKGDAIKTDKNKSSLENRLLKGKTILIAEDGPSIKLYFEKILEPAQAHLLFAKTGTRAVELYEENPDIDIVLMDVRMPEMNGIDAMSKIIEADPEARVIMQTTYVMSEEKETGYERGCKDYLTKPISNDKLLKTLSKWLLNS